MWNTKAAHVKVYWCVA